LCFKHFLKASGHEYIPSLFSHQGYIYSVDTDI
jgi:hypothetical protein